MLNLIAPLRFALGFQISVPRSKVRRARTLSVVSRIEWIHVPLLLSPSFTHPSQQQMPVRVGHRSSRRQPRFCNRLRLQDGSQLAWGAISAIWLPPSSFCPRTFRRKQRFHWPPAEVAACPIIVVLILPPYFAPDLY